ncbi:MAG: preprotein translocase subunit YajC [Lachnospiraceae bacterium]|nr:preprotein translocase subunit YajC [Lachnospira sp.]MBR6698278.1 preprotein translocase subunit YajC [Lachnospiraceae bacterium]
MNAVLASGGSNLTVIILYLVFIIGLFYFIAYRPQKKQQKLHQELMASMEVGDTVMTTSGFYGTLIDITDDVVIVEFGNKNCRIPMKKDAIAEVEKA